MTNELKCTTSFSLIRQRQGGMRQLELQLQHSTTSQVKVQSLLGCLRAERMNTDTQVLSSLAHRQISSVASCILHIHLWSILDAEGRSALWGWRTRTYLLWLILLIVIKVIKVITLITRWGAPSMGPSSSPEEHYCDCCITCHLIPDPLCAVILARENILHKNKLHGKTVLIRSPSWCMSPTA